MFASHHSVTNGFPDGDRHGWVKTKDFLTHTIEDGESLKVVPGDGVIAGRDSFTDFGTETFLDIWVEGEKVTGPSKGTRSGFVL
jgi:hypothetical protein